MTLCWWCCHETDANLKLPYKYNDKTDRFDTMGNFCTWACMKAYNHNTKGVHMGGRTNTLISLMRKKATGKVEHTHIAPSRYVLQAFGGTMSIEEYRKLSKEVLPVLKMPDQVYYVQEVTTRYKTVAKEPTVDDLKHKLNEINSSKLSNEPLKLKRSKPLKRELNNLERTMGIVRKKKG